VSVEEAVRMLSDAPARLFGLEGRGRLAPGHHADLVLFDPATIDAGPVHLVNDLPGGFPRLHAEPVGIERVYVGGVATQHEGKPTGATPARVLRSGRDTTTVATS